VADLLGPGGVYTLHDGDREIRLRLLDPADAAVTGALVGEALHSGGAEATFSTVTALPSRGHEIELSVDVDPGDMDFVEHVSATPTRRAASAADTSPRNTASTTCSFRSGLFPDGLGITHSLHQSNPQLSKKQWPGTPAAYGPSSPAGIIAIPSSR